METKLSAGPWFMGSPPSTSALGSAADKALTWAAHPRTAVGMGLGLSALAGVRKLTKNPEPGEAGTLPMGRGIATAAKTGLGYALPAGILHALAANRTGVIPEALKILSVPAGIAGGALANTMKTGSVQELAKLALNKKAADPTMGEKAMGHLNTATNYKLPGGATVGAVAPGAAMMGLNAARGDASKPEGGLLHGLASGAGALGAGMLANKYLGSNPLVGGIAQMAGGMLGGKIASVQELAKTALIAGTIGAAAGAGQAPEGRGFEGAVRGGLGAELGGQLAGRLGETTGYYLAKALGSKPLGAGSLLGVGLGGLGGYVLGGRKGYQIATEGMHGNKNPQEQVAKTSSIQTLAKLAMGEAPSGLSSTVTNRPSGLQGRLGLPDQATRGVKAEMLRDRLKPQGTLSQALGSTKKASVQELAKRALENKEMLYCPTCKVKHEKGKCKTADLKVPAVQPIASQPLRQGSSIFPSAATKANQARDSIANWIQQNSLSAVKKANMGLGNPMGSMPQQPFMHTAMEPMSSSERGDTSSGGSFGVKPPMPPKPKVAPKKKKEETEKKAAADDMTFMSSFMSKWNKPNTSLEPKLNLYRSAASMLGKTVDKE